MLPIIRLFLIPYKENKRAMAVGGSTCQRVLEVIKNGLTAFMKSYVLNVRPR